MIKFLAGATIGMLAGLAIRYFGIGGDWFGHVAAAACNPILNQTICS